MRGLRYADCGYRTYPPSILIVTDCLRPLRLSQADATLAPYWPVSCLRLPDMPK